MNRIILRILVCNRWVIWARKRGIIKCLQMIRKNLLMTTVPPAASANSKNASNSTKVKSKNPNKPNPKTKTNQFIQMNKKDKNMNNTNSSTRKSIQIITRIQMSWLKILICSIWSTCLIRKCKISICKSYNKNRI